MSKIGWFGSDEDGNVVSKTEEEISSQQEEREAYVESLIE